MSQRRLREGTEPLTNRGATDPDLLGIDSKAAVSSQLIYQAMTFP